MYVHVKPTTKQRILAFFMAFAIIFVSLPYVGIETSAADGDSAVVTSSKSASVSGSYAITGGTVNYTGKILDYADSSVDLFDYKSDQELDSANGSTITSSHASNYTDQHTYLNTAISEGNNYLVSLAANNITIAFSDSTVQSTDTVYVHLWDSVNNTSNNYETKWPGRKMTYDNGLGKFVYTFCPSVLGFTPDSLIFNGGNNTWQTGTIKLYETLEVGNTYSFTKESHGDVKIVLNVTGGASGSSMKIYLWNDSGNTGWVDDDPTESMVCVSGTQFSYNTGNKTWKNIIFYRKTSSGTRWQTKSVTNQTFNYGYTYTYSVNVTNTDWSGSSPSNPSVTATSNGSVKSYTKTSGSRDIYSQYKIPLYFGCFYNPNWTKGYKAAYNNFFWQPNMSLRTDSSASVQQLVDTTLGTSGELKCDGKELPYFSKTLANNNKYKYDFNGTQRNMIECYDGLDFKFYQIQTDAANVRGHDASDTGKSNFYQFNSQETYLYFNGTDFTETEIPIRSQGTQSDSNGTIGFYPFNNTNNSQLNNIAFGAKFTIRFKLGENGKVETVNPANGNGTGKYVNEMFEFKGDDDVWVFIDDNLVLDLGGVHKDTSGYIDFAERKAVATSATTYTDSNRDNLDVSVSSIPKENTNVGTGSETFAFTDLLKDKDYYRTNKKYDPETVHTMTLFYMERGMYESDLLVRFNFETVSNKNTLKVSEVTDFTDVNEGLRSITQKAADNDVFQYTVYNKGTVNDDTRNSEILTPTFDTYTRSNSGYSTKLSGLETITCSDLESIFLDVTNWSGNYKYAVWYTLSNDNPYSTTHRWLSIGEPVEIGDAENIYKFQVPTGTITAMRFLKLPSSNTDVSGENYINGSYETRIDKSSWSPTKGALYRIRTGGSDVQLSDNPYTITYSPTVTRTTNNFAPGSALPNPLDYVAVTNTNYLWTDAFSTTTGTDGKPLAGTTDNATGSFPLMYGTNGTAGTELKESSALFKYQFKTDSDMKVVQSETLVKPGNRNNAPFTTSNSSRSVSDYYKTSVTIKDKYGRVVTDDYDDHDFSDSDAETIFDYVNSPTTQTSYPKDPVEITEEFTNRVLVGAISVKKELVHNTEPGDTFNFTLELTDVLGQDGVDVTDYDTIKVSVDGAAPVADKITTSGGKGTFTLTKGQTLTIYGIPAGTKYNITEETPTDNYQKKQDNDKMSGTVKQGVLKEGQSDYSSYTNYDPHEYNKVVVTNERRVGDLVLNKGLAVSTEDTATEFTFSVKLKSPQGVDLRNYKIQGATLGDYNTTTGEYNFTVQVSNTSRVTITGIPYGTDYTVTELPLPNNIQWTANTQTETGTIGSDPSNVTITNTRQLGKLKLNKVFENKPSNVSDTVTFEVQFTPPVSGMDLNHFSIKKDGEVQALVSNKLTVDVTAGTEVEISNIPVGTGYTVTETTSFGTTCTVNYSGQNGTITSTDSSATVTNTFPAKGSLTLGKVFVTPPAGYSNTVKFTGTLTAPSGIDLSKYITGLAATGVSYGAYDTSNRRYTFTANVTAGTPVTINNIPYGTTYTVDETNLGTNWSKSGEVTSPNEINADNANPTVEITNTYTEPVQQGSLGLTKTLAGDYSSSGVSITTEFTFNVKLTGSGLDFSAVTWQSAAPSSTEQTPTTKTDFDVTVTQQYGVTVNNIPAGASYTITELTPAAGSPKSITGPFSGTIQSGVNSPVNITNVYGTTTVTLNKVDADQTALLITSSAATFKLLKFNSTNLSDIVALNNDFKTKSFTQLSTYFTEVSTHTTDASGKIVISDTSSLTNGYYFFYETSAPTGYIADNSLYYTSGGNTVYKFFPAPVVSDTIINSPNKRIADVTVKKVDESDPSKGLKDAEFELWYKDSTVHPTYTFNDPLTAPLKTTALKVSGTGITVPAAAAPSSYTTYDYTYTYADPSTPSATETEWILPRTDNDYIYFRDFESGTADHDPGLSGHAWLNTWFEPNTTSGVHEQDQEIGYDHKYWFAAQFRKSDNSGFVEYAVWERFVDRYSGFDTVVWKIQPPDGYNKVRFCLYDGSNCIRTTEEFNYELGKIYQKTSWGGIYSNGNYYNVPVNDENPDSWSTYYTTASTAGNDQRNANTTNLNQAERYTPTEQKIIFHCNSQQVWHNIHIEFFGSDGTTTVGQNFPGYMMEPYAYAGSDYRLSNGYLTYELTIPNDAYYFRINNGIDNSTTKGNFDASSSTQSPYAYRTNIQAISTSGNKNNDNYYRLDSTGRYDCLDDGTPKTSQLTKDVSFITNMSHEDTSTTYSSNEVESDSDYIYFAKKKESSGWNAHVYAYFYGGGNLREDNWQRACYSIWPGVAPVASQSSAGNSDIYGYTPSANPESTFTIKKGTVEYTVYKFRMPEGDRKNYSKVIFNDGLNKINGGSAHETSPITYNAGYIYFEDGGSMQHFDNYSTTQYTKRSGENDYLYIKTAETAWDDMHITFYRSDGSQIHQGGTGYVMKYAGTSGGEKYYRIPIPADAAKFKLNNGRDKETPLETDFGDILRYSDGTNEGDNTDYTKGKIVYTLTSPNTLAMVKLFNETQTNPVEHTTGTQDSLIDYAHTRGDKLYIRNTAGWNIDAGGGQVKFYDSSDALITGDHTKGNGTYILIKTVNDSGAPAKEWYTIEIPDDAVSFTLTYNNGANTTARNPIYPKSANGTVTDSNGNYTTGNMYYQTTSGGALSLMTTTVSPATSETDITAAKRSDTLYLLCTSKTEWENMTVTFLNGSGTAITGATGIEASYIAEKDGDHWWSISIPTGAASFTVTKGGNTTTEAEIYPLSQKLSRYKKDYTLGDMQYRLPDPADSSKPGLLYPIFTQDDEYKLEIGGKTITTASGAPLVDESQIASYSGAAAIATPSTTGSEPTSPYPVLYNTTTDNVTYSWGGSPAGNYIYFDNSKVKWSSIYVYLWDSSNSSTNSGWGTTAGRNMTQINSSDIYQFDVSSFSGYNKVLFVSGYTVNGSDITANVQTDDADLNTGYLYEPDLSASQNILYLDASTFNSSNQNIIAKFDTDTNNEFDGEDLNNPPTGITWGDYSRKWYLNNESGKPGDGHSKVKFRINDGGYTDFVNLKNQGHGEVWRLSNTNNWHAEFIGYVNSSNQVDTSSSNGKIPLKSPTSYPGGGSTTYIATYQPEDRYGFITSRDDYSTTPADPYNFIYIDTTISDPYITFYDSNNSAIGGNDMATAGIKLLGVCGNSASPYKIRLPRNAKSFKLADGASGTLGSAMPLEEDITVNAETGQPASSGNTTSITNYRHAGTTFTATSTSSVTATTLRSGFTISREKALSETSPKSDIDYVFFTNTDTTLTGTVYAYFYGDADGEFAHWPGIQSEGSYTDNTGSTVYRFRIPKDTNGTYAKVIFNNGSDAGRKITQAVDATGGKNYTLDTSASTAQYGTNGTNAINAYAVTDTQKASAGSAVYGSNKYIYINNNGTQNLDSSKTNGLDTGTYKLDEMHVIFYDINNAPIGPASTGYIPDRLIVSNAVTDYYRMQVPNGAVYFQITNGEGKGTGSNYYSRQSEIKQITANGLYEFVSGKTNAADYITADSTVPTGNDATRQNPKYLLTLSNEKKVELDDDVPETSTFDVKLAVVVTGEGGTQKYIKWLKQSGGEVDQAYLNHTTADIYNPDTQTPLVATVKVVKNGTYYWKEVVAPAGYELNENTFEFVKTASTTSTVTTTVTDKKISGKVILTKTAKEKVGTTNIGDPLAGAVFKVFKSDGTTVTGFTGTYTTNSEGKLTIEGLSPGDYYLEEQTAPAGYSNLDSNNVVSGTAQKKRVYFSIGDNTTTKYLTCSDEMNPAYIRLFEHINEKLDAWGDPTFIFKITQTKDANDTDLTIPKTQIVALTVNDSDNTGKSVKVLNNSYNSWLQEGTDETDYQGMYHIDSQGRIKVAPGSYEITRIPVSRYKFVTSATTDQYVTEPSPYTQTENKDGSDNPLETVTITNLQSGETIDVHYYDEVEYYDKFSHVDTKVNKFYKLDNSKKNTTVKGISISNIPSTSVTTSGTTGTVNVSAYKVFVDGTVDTTAISGSDLTIDFGSLSGLSYNNGTITITDATTHAHKVYTLTAKYDNNKFTTTFDIAIP